MRGRDVAGTGRPDSKGDDRRVVAFLRAINVGGRTVRMDRLREIFIDLGLNGVSTFIASGNVLFDGTAERRSLLEQRIENALESALGFPVATFLRTQAELREIAATSLFPAEDIDNPAWTLFVGFARAAPSGAAVRRVEDLSTAVDELRVHRTEIYWLRRGRSADSRLSGAAIEKALGGPATLRNITTVRRLAAR